MTDTCVECWQGDLREFHERNRESLEAMAKLGFRNYFDTVTHGGAEFWLRERFQCAYCLKDMLNLEEYCTRAHADHLLPKSRYPKLKYCFNNQLHVCTACNLMKGTFNPADDGSAYDQLTHLSLELQGSLLERVRVHLRALREEKRSEINDILKIKKMLLP